MINRFDEHISKIDIEKILNELSSQKIRDDIKSISNGTIKTYTLLLHNKLIISDYICEYLFNKIHETYYLEINGIRAKDDTNNEELKKKVFTELNRLSRAYNVSIYSSSIV